ncbi:MAG TPA: cyclase family protein [Thermoanaerobaculia bacterium]|nr:cyclase family protein [Thermoanaerobaculia bacterium]
MARLLDLSHTVEAGMVTYKGLPGPVITDHLSREASRPLYAGGTTFHIGKIEMVANTGTYVDAPFHRWEDGADLSQLSLASLAGLDGVVIAAPHAHGLAVNEDFLEGVEIRGRAVLVHSGWAEFWGTPSYFQRSSHLTSSAASLLVSRGAAIVGIDSHNIDDTDDRTRPVHSILLRAGIPVVEHLCGLEALPASGFRFYAVPVKVAGMGTFPVRAFAEVL